MSFFKYVAQDFDLMPYTSVAENIGKFLSRFYPEEKAQRTNELLDVIEMSSFANEKVKTLSGGQQQRVGIARAVVHKPKILLADEPTGNLDPVLSAEIMALFRRFQNVGVTVLIATHDLSLIHTLDHRIICLADGMLISDGGSASGA